MKAKKKDTKIVRLRGNFELDIKRLNLPLKIKTKCPACGEPCEQDLSNGDHYVSAPTLGKPTTTYWLCPSNHEFQVELVIDLNVKLK